jgi:hypothetical protein
MPASPCFEAGSNRIDLSVAFRYVAGETEIDKGTLKEHLREFEAHVSTDTALFMFQLQDL